MTQEEKKIVSIIKEVSKSTVSINVFRQSSKLSKKYTYVDGGSGFVVDENGIIVTSTHVIHKGNLKYEIKIFDKRKYSAHILGIDQLNDIAFLKISSRNKFKPVKFGSSSKLQVGQTVIAIGNALGIFPYTATKGIVSGLFRSIEALGKDIEESLHNLIQTDVAINPGESGGPLIDTSGKIVGMNSAISPKSENLSFAVPSDTIKKDLEEIKKYGKLTRPYLGVRYVQITRKLAEEFGLNEKNGVLIVSPIKGRGAVLKGSPAYNAGLKDGDIITHIDGAKVDENNTLHKILKKLYPVKSRIKLSISRNGKKIVKTIRFN